ncbi:MAG: SUMF1/EgtB/PvdO family nonheme iron enzyme, partial [Gemmatimonadales bacterium]
MSDETASRDLSTTREAIVQALSKIRQRTLDIVAPISESGLGEQHSPLMSPIVWDLGHIAEFEDLWLVERLGEVVHESTLPETFDAMRTPRSRRGELELPGPAAIMARLQGVRSNTLDTLRRVDLAGSGNRLLAGGFVYELVCEHEAQHQETILQTISLMESEPYAPVSRKQFGPPGPVEVGGMVDVPAGSFEMGAPAGSFAYDNELPRHGTRTDAFEIGRFPVTNGEFLEFMAAGGYDDEALWTDAGLHWKKKAGLAAPQYWRPRAFSGPFSSMDAAEVARTGGTDAWERITSLGAEPVRANDPVSHVCQYEAEAYARVAGARLPTETEWEKAAAWDPDSGETLRYPWGGRRPDADLANLDAAA